MQITFDDFETRVPSILVGSGSKISDPVTLSLNTKYKVQLISVHIFFLEKKLTKINTITI